MSLPSAIIVNVGGTIASARDWTNPGLKISGVKDFQKLQKKQPPKLMLKGESAGGIPGELTKESVPFPVNGFTWVTH